MAEILFPFFSNVFLLIISFIACLFLLDFVKRRKNGSRFPPGPKGLPFLGNILQVDYRHLTETLHQLRKEFGDVFSLQAFWKKGVILNGFEVMKEALINRSEDIADRPSFPMYEKIGYVGDTKGIVLAPYGRSWKEQRRFTLLTLKHFGMGRKSLEERVTEEAQCLCSAIKSQKDQFNPHFLIFNAVSNVLCSIVFGNRFDYDNAKFQRLLHLLHEGLKKKSGIIALILNEIPLLMNIPWLANCVISSDSEAIEFLKEIVSEHQKTWNPNKIRDFVDAYLVEMEKVKEDSTSSFNMGNLLMTTYDLFVAGSETSSTTLRWALLYMILYPDVQSKVQEEIDQVIGRKRKPTMGDVLQMPYTNAVIHEIQRCGNSIPVTVRMTCRDMEMKGYIIPKGTVVILNLSSVLKDQRVWEKPLQFYPKHFLNENGKFVKQEAFIPFAAENCGPARKPSGPILGRNSPKLIEERLYRGAGRSDGGVKQMKKKRNGVQRRHNRKNGSQFPPGPKGLPFLGNILQVDFRNPTETFHQLRNQFGDIFSLQYFWRKIVVFNGFEVMKEALIDRSEDIADRPQFPIYEKLGYVGETKGIILARYGNSWKEQRRFTQSTLRNFGMGKKSLEERVTEEAQCLCSAFKSQKDQFNPHFIIYNAFSNVICAIVFGDRFDYDDTKFQRLLRLLDGALKGKSGLLAQILNEIPLLMNIPWLINHVMRSEHEVTEFLKETVSEHQKTWKPNKIRDFIDAYLMEMEKVKEDNGSSFNMGNLLMTTYDLFVAGSETTSTTMRWALLYMILYPDVQSKVQEEIDQVIGKKRKPTMEDVLQMPYTNAVIHEIQRCGDIAPLALPRMTYRDMEIKGYFIPKGTTVITNLSSVLKDQQVWEKPFQFYPNHFLDENGKFVKREAFMPFSAGRRGCLGELLARMEIFLFFTTLLQQLTFEIPNDQPRPREDPLYVLMLSPHPYNIRVVTRT